MPIKRKIQLLVVVVCCALVFGWLASVPVEAQNNCTTYHNSRLWLFGSTWTCAYSGSACTECVTSGGECYWDSGAEFSACNIHPENRW